MRTTLRATRTARATLAALLVLGTATRAHAQAQILPKDDFAVPGEKEIVGWNPSLAGTATVNLVSNSSVVGQADGFSTLLGLGLIAGADYVSLPHVLHNSLTVSESVARTPVVDEFVKTNDVVQLESIYNFFLIPRFGVFGRVQLQTGLFPTEDVRGQPTTWVVKPVNAGEAPEPLGTGVFRQRLAGGFSPFTANESIGLFAEPIHDDLLALSLRAGLAGRHTFADGVFVEDDDKSTPEVEVVRLSDVHQLGFELFGGAQGAFGDGKITYRAGLSILIPTINNDKYDRSVGKLTRTGFEGALTFNVFDWMSLVYSLSITNDAQLFPRGQELTQVQNSLLLTLKTAFVKKQEKPKSPTKEETDLKAANDRAAAAENARASAENARAAAENARAAAESRAQDLQNKLDACNTRCAAVPAAPGTPPAAALPPPGATPPPPPGTPASQPAPSPRARDVRAPPPAKPPGQ